MNILSIETSCDETAIAIVNCEGEFENAQFNILANKTVSQIDIHKAYGGVFPAVAKREHAKALVPLLVSVLEEAKLYKKTSRQIIEHPLREEFAVILEREPQLYAQFIDVVPHIDIPQVDAIAVTTGPGLEPALWVGINFAKALSLIWKVPVISINHMEGHLLSPLLSSDTGNAVIPKVDFPVIGLLVSGGHTELVLVRDWGDYSIIGETKDDAVGEAFDKVARMLGLPYPGGPEISRLAGKNSPLSYELPRPMLHSKDYHFSFSGLKTAVKYLIASLGNLTDEMRIAIAREFQQSAVDVLVTKVVRAQKEYDAHTVILGGGVSANTHLRDSLRIALGQSETAIKLFLPPMGLSTDNALMIAVVGYLKCSRGKPPAALSSLVAHGGSKIDATR